MAQIRAKRVQTMATPLLLPGEIGVINTDLYFGRWNATDGTTLSATKLANQNASNDFIGINSFLPNSTSELNVNFYNYATTPSVVSYFKNGRLYTVDPTADQEVATKAYVDAKVQGLDIKSSVRLASTTALGTLTGLLTVDGVITIAGDRVLVKNQATPSQNGIYVVSAGAWTRATDADSGVKLISAFVFVETGNTLSDTGWTCTNDSITEWTTAITWTQFSGAGTYTADETSLTRSGTQFSIKAPSTTAGTFYLTGFDSTNAASNLRTSTSAYVNNGELYARGLKMQVATDENFWIYNPDQGTAQITAPNSTLIIDAYSLDLNAIGDNLTLSANQNVIIPTSKLKIKGTSTGGTVFAVSNTTATNYTATFPNVTGTVNLADTTTTASRILLSTSTAGQAIWSTSSIGSMAYVANTGTTSITTLGTITTGTWNATAISPNYGGTGLTGLPLGAMLYGSATNVWSVLSSNTTATAKYLRSINSGTPTWQQIAYSEISGTPSTYTPSAHSISSHTATAWRMFYSNATTTAVQELAFGSAGQYLRSAGASATPTWSTIAYSDISGTPSIPTGFSISASSDVLYATGGTNTTAYNATTARTANRFYRHADMPVTSSTTSALKYDGVLYAYQFEGIIDGGVWA